MGGGAARPASDELENAVKALTSTGAGTGDELVPTNMAAMLWDDFFLASRIVNVMQRINMPTNPFDVPLGLGSVTWRKGTENTATTASDPATAKSTLTATELITEQNWSYTLDEDAAVAMAPAIRARLAQSGAEVMDAFALNADATNAATGNINLDDADPDDASYYLSAGQDGLRHAWIVDNTGMTVAAGGDALDAADITGALATSLNIEKRC
jgi:HK97 family phage major capsid protein